MTDTTAPSQPPQVLITYRDDVYHMIVDGEVTQIATGDRHALQDAVGLWAYNVRAAAEAAQ